MVDKSGESDAVALARIPYLEQLRTASGRNDAEISREVQKRGGKATPQAVGKWFKTGKISGGNLRILQELADPIAGAPSTKAQRVANAINAPDAAEHHSIARIRTSITVLRKAVALLALAANEKTPGVITAFAEYLKAAVPDEYFGERGFHVLLEAGLPLAAETPEEEQVSTPEPPMRQSARTTRR